MSVEYILFILRVVFIFVLYFFIIMIARVLSRELTTTTEASAATSAVAAPGRRGAAVPGRAYLVMVDGAESGILRGTALPVMSGTLIGRAGGADLEIADAYTSSEHARFRGTGGRWILDDLESMNGSYVNGQRIRGSHPLADGDTVQLGRVVLQFMLRPPV
ncbi:MAG: FHA domain-containing protein [Thermomicrobiales bacterium]